MKKISMNAIYNSIEYKLNKFSETWTGVSQNLFQTEQMGSVIDFFTWLSSGVDAVTEKLGLFGTVSTAVLIAGITKTAKAVGTAKAQILSAVNDIGRLAFTGDSNSIIKYTNALSGLNTAQQQVAMSTLGLSEAHKETLLGYLSLINSGEQLTIAKVEEYEAGLKDIIAKKLQKEATDELTVSEILAARQKILCKRFSTKSRISRRKYALFGLLSLSTMLPGGL